MGETLAAVIKEPPAWSALPHDTRSPIHLLLRGCLEKDARARIGVDQRGVVSVAAADGGAAGARASRTRARAGGARWRRRPRRPGADLGRTTSAATSDQTHLVHAGVERGPASERASQFGRSGDCGSTRRFLDCLRWTRDGWTIGPLILKRSDQLVGQPLPGTAGARRPFTSPDGQWIGFYQSDGIKKIRAEGGSIQTIAPGRMLPGTLGAVWTDDGTIFFAGSNIRSGIYRVMHTGGEVEPVTQVNPAALEGAHASPHLLPNGRVLLFTNAGTRSSTTNITALDLQTMQRKTIVPDGARPCTWYRSPPIRERAGNVDGGAVRCRSRADNW